MWPGSCSALSSDTASPLAKDPASGSSADTPQQLPWKRVSWQHLCLAPAPLGGCCHVLLGLLSPTNYHQLSSCTSRAKKEQALRCVPSTDRPGQARTSPRSCCISLPQKSPLSLQRGRGSPSPELSVLSWQCDHTLYRRSPQQSRASCESKPGAKSWNNLCLSESHMESSPGSPPPLFFNQMVSSNQFFSPNRI